MPPITYPLHKILENTKFWSLDGFWIKMNKEVPQILWQLDSHYKSTLIMVLW